MSKVIVSKTKPFIPRDKPKTWVISIVSSMIGLLVGGPLAILGRKLGIDVVFYFGATIFILSWFISFVSMATFVVGSSSGKYKKIKEVKWSEQIW